ncbi:MAG: DUF1385 domain-containing protein [Defluviitaleaceae bacterium]|nr:DUF1385 domain-containing protein [Defluviitaleaceae bacterium]
MTIKSTDKKVQPHFYGGQAVMEGVMMRGKTLYSMAVRKPNGEVTVVTRPIKENGKEWSLLKLPVIRGMAAFVSSLSLGMKTLTESAEIATEGIEEEPSRFERFLQDKFGDRLNKILMNISIVLAVGIAMLLFVLLPLWIGGALNNWLINGHPGLLGVIEGLVRLLIFLAYVLLISRSKDIRRVFEYHGAEHKAINAYEQNAELTPDNVQTYSRLHNRCGTSFLLIVMFISILVFAFVRTPDPWIRLASRLILIPVVAGLSYEVIRWAGRSKSGLVKVISFPGLCLQRITTSEPDNSQTEIAITALKAVLEAEKAEANPVEEVKETLAHDH